MGECEEHKPNKEAEKSRSECANNPVPFYPLPMRKRSEIVGERSEK